MARPVTEEIMERRRGRGYFEQRQVRKNIALPESLVRIVERACDRFSINEAEFFRRLLYVYAMDLHTNGPLTQAIETIFTPVVLPKLNADEERELRQSLADSEGLPVIYGMLCAMDGARDDELHTITRNYMMEHVDEMLANLDREMAKRKQDAEQAVTQEAGAAVGP